MADEPFDGSTMNFTRCWVDGPHLATARIKQFSQETIATHQQVWRLLMRLMQPSILFCFSSWPAKDFSYLTGQGIMICRCSLDSQHGKLDSHPANVACSFFRYTKNEPKNYTNQRRTQRKDHIDSKRPQ